MEFLASLEYGNPYLELECEFNLDLTAPLSVNTPTSPPSLQRRRHPRFQPDKYDLLSC